MTGKIQVTLAIIKPHAVKVPAASLNIQRRILSSGFVVMQSKNTWLSKEDAETFYGEHKPKFFYSRLVTLMSSGPSLVHVLARKNAVEVWREIMGPTRVYKSQFTHPYSIRGEYGLSDTRNAVHGSDSEESAKQEIQFFFPKFNYDCLEELSKFGARNYQFHKSRFTHSLDINKI